MPRRSPFDEGDRDTTVDETMTVSSGMSLNRAGRGMVNVLAPESQFVGSCRRVGGS
jgi:hypothetical protein